MNGGMMTCARARRLLSDRLNHPPEPLPATRAAALDAHLHECAACTRFDRRLRADPARLRALPSVPPNPRVLAAVEQRVAASHQGGFNTMRQWLRQGAGVIATALFFVVVSVLAVALLRPGPAAPAEDTAPAGVAAPTSAVSAGAPPAEDTASAGTATPAPSILPTIAAAPTADAWAVLGQRALTALTLAPGSPCPRAEGKRVSRSYAIAIGDGPVYATGLGPDGVYGYRQFGDDVPGYVTQFWLANPSYQGPLLVRGRQLDGPNTLGFAINPRQRLQELRLGPGGEEAVTVSDAPGWRHWRGYTIAPAPGCYAYQVDGEGFSETIVFQVLPGRPSDLLPLPAGQNLPRQLYVTSVVPLGDGQVRVALTGANYLVLRLDVAPAGAPSPALDGPNVQRTDSSAGPVVWRADRGSGRPQEATWDDGQQRYHLTVLDGDPGAWTGDDLLAVVTAFANAR